MAEVKTSAEATTSKPEQSVPDGVLYCANHPNVETRLRCNRCGKPICLKCAQLTDVGYRCPECIRSVQDKYFNAKSSDNLIAFGVALVVAAIASPIAAVLFRLVPFFFSLIIAVLVGGAAGGTLSQIIRRSVNKRRSREMQYFALIGIIIGVLIGIAVSAVVLGAPFLAFFSIPMAIFVVLAASSTYQLLR